MKRVIITSEYYNAFYENGVLKHEARPDYLHGETLHTIFPEAEYYGIDYILYDELIGDQDGYPTLLEDFPLDQCKKYV